MNPEQYWKNNVSISHITPANIAFPEVDLYSALSGVVRGSVFEFGCGYGRLAPCFDPKDYYGFDINRHAIEAANNLNPGHEFGFEWRGADNFLAYTVLLHVPDDEIKPLLDRAKSEYKRIVIGEIMGRKWRRPGDPPVFNRELSEYVEMIDMPYKVIKVPYPRYKCDLDLVVFDDD